MNLLKETTEVLNNHGKTWDDVLWVGGKDFSIPVENFMAVADVEYDNGYGAQEVASDLKIVGDGWWLKRNEYDGSE